MYLELQILIKSNEGNLLLGSSSNIYRNTMIGPNGPFFNDIILLGID